MVKKDSLVHKQFCNSFVHSSLIFMFSTVGSIVKSPASMLDHQHTVELSKDTLCEDETKTEKAIATELNKGPSFITQSAIALRCRVMPPPCLKNPYIKDAVEVDVDPFGSWRTKCSGFSFYCFFY